MQNRDEMQHFAEPKKAQKSICCMNRQNYPTETEFRKVVASSGLGTGREEKIQWKGAQTTLKVHDCSIPLETLQQ